MDRIGRYSDILMAGLVVLIIILLLVPLPPPVLDLLVALNFALSLLVMLVTIYTLEPLHFSVFPTLLLFTTLFRLAVGIAITRQILVLGYSGSMVNSFGNFVIGGNIIVGLVVFFIIVVVQFVVITSGASRVAEVAARFTLDAMPGKQMSIDADLNAGLISDDEARKRRLDVGKEADFYGAMDGASKFVKGDAIAAILIVFINLLGGLAVGMFQKGMDLGAAVQTYSILTIGCGLVTQIPALLVSAATGVIVTRAASDANLGSDFSMQMLRQPKAMRVGGGIILAMGLVPGLPKLPFIVLGAGILGLSYAIPVEPEVAELEEPAPAGPASPEELARTMQLDPMELELGYGLIPLVDSSAGADFTERVVLVRRQIALELGMVVPPIRVRDNLSLDSRHYQVKVRGAVVTSGDLMLDGFLALNPGTVEGELPGTPTTEPAFGLAAIWIEAKDRDLAVASGYTVVDPISVLLTHLTETIRRHAAELLTRQDTQALLDMAKETSPTTVEEVVPALLTVGDVQRVLQGLLTERVPIRDLSTILEALGDAAKSSKDPGVLTEHARHALCRTLSQQSLSDDGLLRVITLDPSLETAISNSIYQVEGELVLGLDPAVTEQFISNLASQVESVVGMGHPPVLICSSSIRRFVRKLTEKVLARLTVLSYDELASEVDVRPVGMVTAPDRGEPDAQPV